MRYRFQSTAPQPGLTEDVLVEAAEMLRDLLKDDPVLQQVVTAALPRISALGVQAIVHANGDDLAKAIVMQAADEAWASALRANGFQTADRTGHMRSC